MMGNSPEVWNLDRLYLQLNRFMCKRAVWLSPCIETERRHSSETRTHAQTHRTTRQFEDGRRKQNHLSTSPLLSSPLRSAALLFLFVSSNSSTVAIRTHIISSLSAFSGVTCCTKFSAMRSSTTTGRHVERERGRGRGRKGGSRCYWVRLGGELECEPVC
jgi:hypothetical protein